MISLRQKELHEWQIKNFGTHPDDADRVFQGMVEEIGELAHAILKNKQHIREYSNDMVVGAYGTMSPGDQKFRDNIADAFGDIIIYGIQLMTEHGIDAEWAISDTIEKVLQRDWRKDASGKSIS